jgi:hypothetical protein
VGKKKFKNSLKKMKTKIILLSLFFVCIFSGCLEIKRDEKIYLNQVQTLMSHNSYKYTSANNPIYQLPYLKYSFPPIQDQLKAGIRGFEFDIQGIKKKFEKKKKL